MMRFHLRAARPIDGRADADVRHRRADDAVDRAGGGVDAVRRQELVLRLEIRGRKADGPAAAVAFHDGAVHIVLMPEQRPRLVDAALAEQPPNPRAADDEVLVADRIDLLGVEPVARAERPQQREIAGAIVAEQKVGADPDLGDAQPVHQHRLHERFRIPSRQLQREAHDRRALDAGRRDRLEPLRRGHQERRRLVGADDPWRVRIERHDDRRAATLARHALHAVENLPMAAVHAVEIAEREHRVRPARRALIVGEMNDVHGYGTAFTTEHAQDTEVETKKGFSLRSSVSSVVHSLSCNLQHQPIIGQLDAVGQARAGGRVRQIVTDVREVGAFRRDARHRFDRFADR